MPEETSTEELPPFSFLKKPIRSFFPASAFSSILDKNLPDSNKPEAKPLLNNINYDEQIRAPRMSAATHYTYQPELPRPFTDRTPLNLTMLSQISGQDEQPIVAEGFVPEAEAASTVVGGRYTPATVDLTAPTRRNLAPPKSAGLITSALLTYASHHYFENGADSPDNGSDGSLPQDQQKLLRALDNLNNNMTAAEREQVAMPDERGRPLRNRVPSSRGVALQLVYELKKPLSTPAVLRPADDVDDVVKDPSGMLVECPFQLPADEPTETPVEPSHDHWMPNQSSDHCVKCFEVFGTIFGPQKRRRHHCRFCGMLFCASCMYKSKDQYLYDERLILRRDSGSLGYLSSGTSSDDTVTEVMMDGAARLVIPVFKNFNGQSSVQELRRRFKKCKMCKGCGVNYQRFVQALNLRILKTNDDISTAYVFIENPYLTAWAQGLSVVIDTARSEAPAPERQALLSAVPPDWTWSSF